MTSTTTALHGAWQEARPSVPLTTAPAAALPHPTPRRVRATTPVGELTLDALLGGPSACTVPSALDVDPRLLLVARPRVSAAPGAAHKTLLPPTDERREERELRRRWVLSAVGIVLGAAATTSAVTIAIG